MRRRRQLWSIVLAGGEGEQLRPVMTETYGAHVPKQFCAFNGDEPLVRGAIRRALAHTRRDRVVTVVSAEHRQWWAPLLADLPAENTVVQPCNRGTACGVLLPLIHVLLQDPDAVVMVFPSDHFVVNETVLARTVSRALDVASKTAGSIVLLGSSPERPDSSFGWIEPTLATFRGVHWVLSFVEKPVPELAEELMRRGALWNSFIFVAHATALLAAFTAAFPDLVDRFGSAWVNRDDEASHPRLEQLYQGLPRLDLARDLFQPNSARLRVVPIPPCGWTDLGTPEQIARCVERATKRPTPGPTPHPDLARAVSSYARRS